MKNSTKITICLCATIIAVVAIRYGGKLYAANQNPERAFDLANTSNKANSETKGDTTINSASEPENSLSADIAPQQTSEVTQPTPTPAPEQALQNDFVSADSSIIALTLLGIDTSEEREAQDMGWRSDAIIVLAVDVKNAQCTAITVPRDTRATVRVLNSKGKVKSQRTDKINAAYAYGGGKDKFSHENALYSLSILLGVDLKYYASIDMDAIGPLCDAVGGVSLTLDATIPSVGKNGETVLLDGEKAYVFLRRRKGVADGSDVSRTQRQQQFFKALALKVKNMNALSAVPMLVSSLGSDIRTNLSLEQIIALASVLSKTDEGGITFETLPGSGQTIKNTSYYIADKSKTKKLVDSVFTS